MIVELNQPLQSLPFDARVYVVDHTRRLVLMYPARLLADRPNDLYVDTVSPFPDPPTAAHRIARHRGHRVEDMAREAWGMYPGTDSEGWGVRRLVGERPRGGRTRQARGSGRGRVRGAPALDGLGPFRGPVDAYGSQTYHQRNPHGSPT